jgi:hypothetical protein
VHASTIPRLHQAYKKIAKKLKLPGWDDLNVDTFELIRDWLSKSKNGDWLLVLDNADDINIFYQPQRNQMMDEDEEMHHHMAEYPATESAWLYCYYYTGQAPRRAAYRPREAYSG